MKFNTISNTSAEKIFVRGYNSIGSTVSAGYLVCFHVRTAASANGIDLEKPVTSALPAFAGVMDVDTPDQRYGFVQVYGYSNKAYISASGGETIAPGQVLGPITAVWYASSAGASTQLGPIIVLSQRAGGVSQNPVFIRAL